jgi:predicted phosphohydrolase
MSKIFKFQLFSDIHLEFLNYYPKIVPLARYLFLAGDIGKLSEKNYKPFFDYCSKCWTKTFYVLGNHEYYSTYESYQTLNEKYKDFCNKYSNIHLLDNSYYDIDDIDTQLTYRIYGSTLWSQVESTKYLNDFNMIKMLNDKQEIKPLDQLEFNNLHNKSVKKLIDQIKTEPKNLIIMSHFPPLRKTITQPNLTSSPIFQNQNKFIKKYFANDFTDEHLINEFGLTESKLYSNIKAWLSGHTHYSYDFNYHTRFIANQVGYPHESKYNQVNWSNLVELI